MTRFRYLVAAALLTCCVALLALGTQQISVSAQTLPPRPTDVPVTPTVTATVAPTPKPKRRTRPTEVPTGRIAGTVIDLTTGAPVAGAQVTLNGTPYTTDRNGNYDVPMLPADTYTVTLLPAAAFGPPAQPPVILELERGGTRIQHLFFARRPLPTPVQP